MAWLCFFYTNLQGSEPIMPPQELSWDRFMEELKNDLQSSDKDQRLDTHLRDILQKKKIFLTDMIKNYENSHPENELAHSNPKMFFNLCLSYFELGEVQKRLSEEGNGRTSYEKSLDFLIKPLRIL
jgi:hypothetical protein